MNLVIGQEKLVKILEGYTLKTAPKIMLFLGESGCGKTWIAGAFAKQLDLPVVNIQVGDSKVSSDDLRAKLIDAYQCPVPKMYIFDLVGANDLRQNLLLKIIEEPSSNMNIILTARSEVGILPTILNRCIKYQFEEYTVEQLKKFDWAFSCDDTVAYEICRTPGQLLELSDDKVQEIFNYCNLLLGAKGGTYANTIAISTKINCKDDATKYDFNLFFDILTYCAFKKYKEKNDEFSYKVYMYITQQRAKILNKTIAKESFLLSFCNHLWELKQ